MGLLTSLALTLGAGWRSQVVTRPADGFLQEIFGLLRMAERTLFGLKALDERLRAKFYPDAKQSHAINYAVLSDGNVILRRTLLAADEGKSQEIPSAPRFQMVPDNRLLLFCYISGKNKEGVDLSENRIMEILSDGEIGPQLRVPLKKPFTSYFTATTRAGSAPSDVIELLGRQWGVSSTISYARIKLR